MRTTFPAGTRTVLPLALALALALGACTSGPDPAEQTGQATSAQPSDPAEAAAATEAAARGWVCRHIGPDAVLAVAGEEPAQLQGVTVKDDQEGWTCEARDGQQPLVRVSIERGEAARDAAQERAEAAAGVQDGPEHLGVSYESPRLVTGLTLCRDVDNQGSQDYEPYTLVAEALTDSEDDVSAELRATLGLVAANLDQTIGCSPRQAREDAGLPSSP